MNKFFLTISLGAVLSGAVVTRLEAQSPTPSQSQLLSAAASRDSSSANPRYGLFDWLDHRSTYGEGIYPEPFLVDDSDLEPNEARLDWLHTGGPNSHTDSGKFEVEKGFGLLTLELEVPYERDVSGGQVTEGIGNLSIGARHPLFQYVSRTGFIDSTFGAALEVGIPVHSSVSKNTEFVPKVFNDLKVGDHFTMQSVLGHSTLFGPGPDGGLQNFEYGFVFGCTFAHKDLPLPHVTELIPVFELKGETGLNMGNSGHNTLLGNAGFRVNLKVIGQVQPRLGLGFVFPIDRGARQDTHWGIFTSLVFQY
jgi:hypothetical protein